MNLERHLSAWVAGAVALFGTWSAAACVGIGLHGGVTQIIPGLAVVAAAGIAAGWWEWRRAAGAEAPAEPGWTDPAPKALALTLAAAVAVAVLPFSGAGLTLVWGAALILLLAGAVVRERARVADPVGWPPAGRWDGVLLAVAAVLAVAVTVLSNRPQYEEYRYLWMLVHLIHNPDRPVLDLLTFYEGRGQLYAWHPREVLYAGLVHLTGLPVAAWYFYVLPVLHALMSVAVLYLAARQFRMAGAAWVAVVAVTVLVAWGDSHQTFGNFSFARLFQGQAVLATWAAPVCFLYGVRFGRRPGWWDGLLVLAAVVGAFGQWHTGAIAGPLAALCGALAAWRGRGRLDGVVVAAVIALALAGAFVILGKALPQYYLFGRHPVPALDGLTKVFPPGLRSVLALAAAVCAGLLLSGPGGRLAGRVLLCGLILVLNPFGMELLGGAIKSLSFRVLWGIPFVLLIGLAVVAGAQREMRRWRLPVVTAAAAVAFLAGGRWVTADTNYNDFGNWGVKLDPVLAQWLEQGQDTLPPMDHLPPIFMRFRVPGDTAPFSPGRGPAGTAPASASR